MRRMEKKRTQHRVVRVLLMLLFVAALMLPDLSPAVQAVSQSEIDSLKNSANKLDASQKELKDKIAALNNDKAKVLQQKNLLDQQIANTQAQIANAESRISTCAALIAQTEEELEEAQEQEQLQNELFRARVRAMEERGTISYWSVLFNASSFSDMLSRLDAINEIMDSDRAVIEQLQQLQAEIQEKQDSLKSQKAEAESAKSELVSRRSELDAQRTQAEELMADINEESAEYKSQLAASEAEEARLRAEAQALAKKLAEEQAASGNTVPQSNPGGYIWPVDSRYITSTVGGRTSPGGIGSTNHKGTDIGRVGYTSSVYASKAGTVIVSKYSDSYGNYVVISHGGSNTTLYAHMSSRSVKVGDKVSQGQVIGITGSTGHSTGPHLHFEVVENGVLVNPLNHGAAPKKGYLSGYTLSGSA